MKLHLYLKLFAFVAVMLSATVQSEASGSYRTRLPQPKTKDAERSLYALGQQIFDGKAKLVAVRVENTPDQAKRLRAVQAELPERLAKNKDLLSLSGRLTPEQLGALEYYVAKRFSN